MQWTPDDLLTLSGEHYVRTQMWEALVILQNFSCQPPSKNSWQCPNEPMWDHACLNSMNHHKRERVSVLMTDAKLKKKNNNKTNISGWKHGVINVQDANNDEERAFGAKGRHQSWYAINNNVISTAALTRHTLPLTGMLRWFLCFFVSVENHLLHSSCVKGKLQRMSRPNSAAILWSSCLNTALDY